MKITTVALVSVGFLACVSKPQPQDPNGSGGNGTSASPGSGGRTGTGGTPPTQATGGAPAPGTGGSAGGGGTPVGSGGGGPPVGTGGAGPADGGGAGDPDGGPAAPGPAAGPGPFDPEQPATPGATELTKHKHSMVIKMDTTAAGANVAAAVAKYPVVVLLNAQNFDFSQAQELGQDIRFSKMDGTTVLPYNLESWDKTGKQAVVWVKLDEVKGNDNTQSFLMHWGNPAATSASDPKAVFPMADGFIGVYHLNEEGNAAPGGYKDASGHQAHMTGVMMAPGSRVDGRTGKGTLLTNSKTDYKKQWLRLDGEKNAMFNAVGHAITASIWTKVNSFGGRSKYGSYETVFSKGDTSWTMQRVGSNDWEACTKGPGMVTWHNCAIIKGAVVTGQWLHFTLVLNDAGITAYLNGERRAGAGNGKRFSDHPYGIGQQTQSLADGREWDGIVDEARVLAVAKDANWVKLDFESQKEGSKFLSYGPAQTK